MTATNLDDTALTEERRKNMEAGQLAFQQVCQERDDARAARDKLQAECKLLQLEVDRFQVDVADSRDRVKVAEAACAEAVAQRTAFEVFMQLLAKQLVEFIPPSPMRKLPASVDEIGQHAVGKALNGGN